MLRDYQINICTRVSEAFEHHRSVMVQMPTGTGKTVVLAELVKRLMMKDEGLKILIVAHRRELIEQIKATVKRMGLNTNDHLSLILNQSIIVESIQTIPKKAINIRSLNRQERETIIQQRQQNLFVVAVVLTCQTKNQTKEKIGKWW